MSGLLLDGMALGSVVLALVYLAKVRMPRPPVGRFNRADIVIMVVLLVVLPFAYLHAPTGLVATVFAIVILTGVQFTLAPLIGGRTAFAVAVAVCAAELTARLLGAHGGVTAGNDVAVVVIVVGVTNMWTQAGMTTGQVAGLAAALTVYDTLATGVSSVTADFVDRVAGLPFAPLLALRFGGDPIFYGLGDCLLLALWPLVAARAYGRVAALAALAVDVVLVVALFAAFQTGLLSWVPLLTPLGPCIVAQYLYWRRRTRRPVAERTPVVAALAALPDLPEGWSAVHEGVVVGTGGTPGEARRAARLAGVEAVPVTVRR